MDKPQKICLYAADSLCKYIADTLRKSLVRLSVYELVMMRNLIPDPFDLAISVLL